MVNNKSVSYVWSIGHSVSGNLISLDNWPLVVTGSCVPVLVTNISFLSPLSFTHTDTHPRTHARMLMSIDFLLETVRDLVNVKELQQVEG